MGRQARQTDTKCFHGSQWRKKGRMIGWLLSRHRLKREEGDDSVNTSVERRYLRNPADYEQKQRRWLVCHLGGQFMPRFLVVLLSVMSDTGHTASHDPEACNAHSPRETNASHKQIDGKPKYDNIAAVPCCMNQKNKKRGRRLGRAVHNAIAE